MKPSDELLEQHEKLRDLMDRCEALADEADRTDDPTALTREVAKLRLAFDAHNLFEEQLLGRVLVAQVDEHVREHAAIRTRLHGWVTEELREVIANLRAHLEVEEAYLVSRCETVRPSSGSVTVG